MHKSPEMGYTTFQILNAHINELYYFVMHNDLYTHSSPGTAMPNR